MDGINNFRIKFDKAVDYIPVASFINNSIDLIQRRSFAHRTKANLSDYQKHIVNKAKRECLINMIPFGKIINKILHRKNIENGRTPTQSSSSNGTDFHPHKPNLNFEIQGKSGEDLYSLPMDLLVQFLSTTNEEGEIPLEDGDNLKVLLPLILDKLSTRDLKTILSKSNIELVPSIYSRIDQEIVDNLSKEHCLRLTAILSSLNEEEIPEGLVEILPPFAKSYMEILTNHSDQSPNSSINKIEGMRYLSNTDRMAAIAHIIEAKEIPLRALRLKERSQDFWISLAPHLRYVNIKGFVNPYLDDFLENCSNVNSLDCRGTSINKLPEDMLQLQELYCNDCPQLTALPVKMPLLKKLFCHHCPELTTLPVEMPLLEHLDCCYSSITDLPFEMPQIRVLIFSGNPITALPAVMPKLQELYAVYCPQLTVIQAEMPNLRILYCYGGPQLNAISTLMPQLQELYCNDCPQLIILPAALPQCSRLDYSNSPLITEIPQMPFGVQVIYENAPTFTSLNINTEKFKTAPRILLQELGKFLLRNRPFPNVIYYDCGQRSEAIDAGGVRKDLVTKLFENIFKENFKEIGASDFLKIADFMPIARGGENEKADYQTLGILMAHCFAENSEFKTGPVFSEDVYRRLQTPYAPESDAWFLHNFLKISNLSESAISYFINQKSAEFPEADLLALSYRLGGEVTARYLKDHGAEVREKLLISAREDLSLQALSWMAEQMQDKMGNNQWHTLQALSATALKGRIEGILTVKALKDKLRWEFTSTVSAEDRAKTQNFILHWIDHHDSLDKLELFVRAVTSNRTLTSKNLLMNVGKRDKDFIPSAHTCFNTLELTSECESQEQFDAKLEILFEHMSIGSGFSSA